MVDKAEFFYSTNTPHKWSSGATLHYWGRDYEPLKSLEDAKAAALVAQKGRPGEEDYVETSYGVTYKIELTKEDEVNEV